MATKKTAAKLPLANSPRPSARSISKAPNLRQQAKTNEVNCKARAAVASIKSSVRELEEMGLPVSAEELAGIAGTAPTIKLDPLKGEFAFPARQMLDAALAAELSDSNARATAEQKNPTSQDFLARMFRLHRHDDHTGSTGDGVVAEGIEWTDGTVTVRWKHGDTTNHTNLKTLATMHFNRGSTTLIWM